MTISRRSVVKGGAWSVPAVAMAAAAPAVAASTDLKDVVFTGRFPSWVKRPQVADVAAGESCDTSLIFNTQLSGYNDLSRKRWTYENNTLKLEDGSRGSAGALINLSGTGIDSTVTVSKLTISFGYWVSPTTGYTGSFDPGTFKWTANRTESSLWSTPTATGRTVTYTPDEFVNGGGTPDKPKKTTSSAPTPTNNLTFSLYTSSISNPATALVSGSSSNTLYIDVPFQWSNQSTWTTNMSRVSSKNGSCGDGSTIAYYQYAEFLIEYSKNGKSYSSRFWLVNGSKFS